MLGLVFAGIVSGIISGMGIGGGTILIPALTMIWSIEQKAAQNINLIYFIPTAIVALIAHIKNKKIEKDILITIIIGGLIGAVAGSFLAMKMDSHLLRKIFGFFLFIMGIAELLKKK